MQSFFGRTYNNINNIAECKNGNRCVINKKNRTTCKACRLNKCISVGMSKSSSRYGRRSNWFKMYCLLTPPGGTNNPSLPSPANGATAQHYLNSQDYLATLAIFNQEQSDRRSFCSDEDALTEEDPNHSRAWHEIQHPSHPDAAADNSSEEERMSDVALRSSPERHYRCTSSSYSSEQETSPRSSTVNANLTLRTAYQRGLGQYNNMHMAYAPPGLVTPTTSHHILAGGDRLLISPNPGHLADEQNEPIDLSVRASRTTSQTNQTSQSSQVRPANQTTDDDDEEQRSSTPLDLTMR